MADFDTLEQSRELSRPVEIFDFVIGTEEWNYTSAASNVTIGSTEYEAVRSLKRNSVAQGADEKNRALQISMPSSTAFAERWKRRPTGVLGSVTVFRVQRDETPAIGTNRRQIFKGVIASSRMPDDGKEAILQVLSIEGSAGRQGPRYSFSGVCGHFLFDSLCKVDPALHKFSGTVTVEDNTASTITVPGLAAFSTKFTSGYVKPPSQSDYRLVLAQSGDVLELNIPFRESVDGIVVDCFKGCDHLIDGDCDLEYDNVIEFGGDPFVPDREIFAKGLGI